MTYPAPGESPAYPVRFDVSPHLTGRDRVTVGFRLILVIPHMIILGGFGAFAFGGGRGGLEAAGALGSAAFAMAFIAWFAIVFNGTQPRGLWEFAAYYLRWWTRVSLYLSLLRDEYPPFGDEPYPMMFELRPPETARNRVTVGFRFILVIPQIIVLFFVDFAWVITTIISWFAIIFTGRVPEDFYRFGVGVLRWNVRVQAYVLLLRDEYPPFHLEP